MDKKLSKGVILVKDKTLYHRLKVIGLYPIDKYFDTYIGTTFVYEHTDENLETIEKIYEVFNEED